MAPVKKFTVVLSAIAQVTAILDAAVPQDNSIIPGRFVVGLKPNIDKESHLSWVQDVHKRSISRRGAGAGIHKTYGFGAFQGYSGEFDDDTIAQIRESSNVTTVEPDRVAHFTTILVTQTNVTWGLESISSLAKEKDDNFTGHRYLYDDSAASGTYGYLIDTGMQLNDDFEGRVIRGYNAWEGTESFEQTIYGHGTHTGGTLGSRTYGVAKKATIVDVKVGSGNGDTSVSKVLDGFNWAVNNITNTPGRAAKSVISISIGLERSDILNSAIKAAYDEDIITVAASGNDNRDASTLSPASEESAVTVGSVDWTYARADFSNFGPIVDIFAPGVNVTSWWWTWEGEMTTYAASGTSVSAPHIAGLILYLKGLEEGLASAEATVARLKELAQKGVVSDSAGSSNLLAYNNAG